MQWLVMAFSSYRRASVQTAVLYLNDSIENLLKISSTSAADGSTAADVCASARRRSALRRFAFRPPAAPLAAAG